MKKMTKRFNMVLEGITADTYEMDEHNISREQNPAELSSQECVEDRPRISNMIWVSVRSSHKRSKDNKLINRGRAHRRTYAEVATPSSE